MSHIDSVVETSVSMRSHWQLDREGQATRSCRLHCCKRTPIVRCVDCLKLHLSAGPKYICLDLLGIQKCRYKREMTSSYYASKPNPLPNRKTTLIADAFERPRIPQIEVRGLKCEYGWKNQDGGNCENEIFVKSSNKVRYRQRPLRCRFNAPETSWKVRNGPWNDPLAPLRFPFIGKGTRRKAVSRVLDGDFSIL